MLQKTAAFVVILCSHLGNRVIAAEGRTGGGGAGMSGAPKCRIVSETRSQKDPSFAPDFFVAPLDSILSR